MYLYLKQILIILLNKTYLYLKQILIMLYKKFIFKTTKKCDSTLLMKITIENTGGKILELCTGI